MSDEFKITYYQKNSDDGSQVVATFGIYIPKLDEYKSKNKLIRKKDGATFVAPYSERYTDPQTGEAKHANIWWYGNKMNHHFQRKCKEAILKYCQENKIEVPFSEHERARKER